MVWQGVLTIGRGPYADQGGLNGGKDEMNWLEEMRGQVSPEVLPVVDHVWNRRNSFIRWPARAGCWWPGCVRERFHQYSSEQRETLSAARINVDPRSNGPAILSFLMAGGERPVLLLVDADVPVGGHVTIPDRVAIADGSIVSASASAVK